MRNNPIKTHRHVSGKWGEYTTELRGLEVLLQRGEQVVGAGLNADQSDSGGRLRTIPAGLPRGRSD